jgi:hypothetical protein
MKLTNKSHQLHMYVHLSWIWHVACEADGNGHSGINVIVITNSLIMGKRFNLVQKSTK